MKDPSMIDLLMPAQHMGYTTKHGVDYTSDENGLVSVDANDLGHLVFLGGIPLPPVITKDDGSIVAWTDPRLKPAS
jgi:hypothetical protein